MNTNTGIGFKPTLPSLSEINKLRNHFKSIIRNWRTQKLKVVFAYLNALTYRACRQSGALVRVRRARGDSKGFHKFVGDIKAIALKGIGKFNIAIESMVDQLANFWDVTISEASLRKYRYELRDVFGLFKFESFPLSYHLGRKGDVNNRRPPALEKFSLPKACILLEVLEDVLVKERDCELEDFPGCGAMGRFIYNALFKGVVSYRRKSHSPDAVVMIQGDRVVWASEFDWNDNQLTESGEIAWYGGVRLIPNENGVLPELIPQGT
jgi:hypothetical protein